MHTAYVHTLLFSFIFLQTALHIAAQYNESGIVHALLQHGASQRIVDNNGMCDQWYCCASDECTIYQQGIMRLITNMRLIKSFLYSCPIDRIPSHPRLYRTCDGYVKRRDVLVGEYCAWTPRLGEHLPVRSETGNNHDKYAVSVIRQKEIVGHVPRHDCIHMDDYVIFLRVIGACA